MKSVRVWCWLAIVCSCMSLRVNAQSDYLVTVTGDSIYEISITGYPGQGILNVNCYTKKLSQKYEDFHIYYKKADGSELSEPYSDVKAFSTGGIRKITWHARPVQFNQGKVEISKVVNAEGKSRDQLYGMARSYLIGKLNLSADAIDKFLVEDKENGIIKVNNLRDYVNTYTPYDSPPFTNWIMYDMTIRVKDNRSKISLSNFRCHYETGKVFDNKYVEASEISGETLVSEWREENGTIYSHLYQGLLLMFYYAEDVTVKEFEKQLTAIDQDDDW